MKSARRALPILPKVGDDTLAAAGILDFLLRLEAGETREFIHAFLLDGANRLLWSETMTVGGKRSAYVDYRELVGMALRVNAVGLILSHNHPSGSAKPSARDVSSTLDLQRLCSKIGIDLVDHIIVAAGSYFSFRAKGIL